MNLSDACHEQKFEIAFLRAKGAVAMHPMSSPVLSPAIPQLPSGNLGVTAAFLRERLGFTDIELYAEHGHLIAVRDSAEIHFWLADSEEAARHYGSAGSCYIKVRHIAALYDEFRERGAPFGYALTLQPWGMLEMQINDPYGNAIRFGEIVDD
jgi:uncharacterized glyoxalase superfamily protein PhnB